MNIYANKYLKSNFGVNARKRLKNIMRISQKIYALYSYFPFKYSGLSTSVKITLFP